MKKDLNASSLKFFSGFIVCLIIRLIPFRLPNIEPILTTTMPFSLRYGAAGGFLFGFFSIVIYDVILSKVGIWTLITAVLYGSLGVLSSYYFKSRESSRINYVKFAIAGTIYYDLISGIGIGVFVFKQSFMVTLLGQIPFTAMHLLGNIAFALILSPVIYRWVVNNNSLEFNILIKRLGATLRI